MLEGIAETLKAVLPFVTDLRPAITKELQRNVYLRLYEQGIEEPLAGWLLSQGTLRIVALLAVLRHPTPPSVVFIEEVENGLDPRTIHLLVEEIRSFLQSGGQVVATTLSKLKHPHGLGNKLKDYKAPDRQIKRPKSALISLFQRELGKTRKYIDRNHALLLAQEITNWSKLCRSDSFCRFATKAARVKM